MASWTRSSLFLASCAAGAQALALQKSNLESFLGANASQKVHQSVHWVFTTDCSAYMFNQGNLFLASAYHVEQPGEFTWVVYGCDRDEQKEAFKKLAHPRAKVWHMEEQELVDPVTGERYQDFQASNRPVSVAAWWKATQPKEEAIAIIDPDMTWMRAVHLVDSPAQQLAADNTLREHLHSTGPWESFAAQPKRGTGARYGQGCIPGRWTDEQVSAVCGDAAAQCLASTRSDSCATSYSSGPPWILHRDDAEEVYGTWVNTAVKTHQVYPELLAEQVSYGVAQMKFGIKSTIDAFWFLSAPGGNEQPWDAVAAADYDPCDARAPPSADMDLPPIWHACSTFRIDHLKTEGFTLHKDHIHKDLLDCDAPLLHYAPKDSLQKYELNSQMWRDTWSVCTYTNLVNFYAGMWKTQYCEKPNLEPTFAYTDHSEGFLNEDSWLNTVFRRGGWQDVDYTIGKK